MSTRDWLSLVTIARWEPLISSMWKKIHLDIIVSWQPYLSFNALRFILLMIFFLFWSPLWPYQATNIYSFILILIILFKNHSQINWWTFLSEFVERYFRSYYSDSKFNHLKVGFVGPFKKRHTTSNIKSNLFQLIVINMILLRGGRLMKSRIPLRYSSL